MSTPTTKTHAHLLCRQQWYADGCPGLEEGKAAYFATGEVVLDAAADLKSALELIEPTWAGRRYPDAVLQALAEFDAARTTVNRLRKERNAFACERIDEGVRCGECEGCAKREPLHQAYEVARKAMAKTKVVLARRLDSLKVEPKRGKERLRRLCRKKFEEHFPEIKTIARSLGYAVAVHGSLERDIDLIFAPWKKDATSPIILAEAVRAVVGGFFAREGMELNVCRRAPIGVSCMIHLGGGPYLDCLIVCSSTYREAIKEFAKAKGKTVE